MQIQYRLCCFDMQQWFTAIFVFDGCGLTFLADPRVAKPDFCPFCGQAIVVDELDSEEVGNNNAAKD